MICKNVVDLDAANYREGLLCMRRLPALSLIISLLIRLIVVTGTAVAQTGASSGEQCADLRYLMANDITPLAILSGGGVLQPDATATGQIAPNDIGDVWSLLIPQADRSTVIGLRFDNVPAGFPMEFTVFQGMNRVSAGDNPVAVLPGETFEIPATRSGIYTIVVRLKSIASVVNLSGAQAYSLRASFPGGGDPASTLRDLRDEATGGSLVIGRDFRLDAGEQIINFNSGAEARLHPGAIRSVSTRPGAAAQLFFEGQGSLLLDNWAQSIALLGGDLAVSGIDQERSRIYYIERFGHAVTLVNSSQSSLRDITDSYQARFVTDWVNIAGFWAMSDCLGIKLDDGRSFIAETSDQETRREFVALGAPTQARDACEQFYIRANALDRQGEVERHSLCFPWEAIAPGTELSLQAGVLDASITGERRLGIESTEINLQPRPANGSGSFPLDIVLEDLDTRIALDWVDMQAFRFAGERIDMQFIDAPRSSTSRDGVGLASLTALENTVHIVYQGADPRELLMLPAEESYIEIITPQGEPTFDSAAFDARALPNTAGYQPRALNNLGGECYPVNTVLPEANCPPAGEPNPANGNLWLSVVDHIAFHPLHDLTLTRSYNSLDAQRDGPFGFGWRHDYPIDSNAPFDMTANARLLDSGSYGLALELTWAPRGLLMLTTASGSRHSFIRESVGAEEIYRALTMPGWTLSREGGDTASRVRSAWILSQPDGLIYRFDRAGRLRSFGYEAQGHQVRIEYPYSTQFDGPGALDSEMPVIITDSPELRQLELYYDTQAHIVRSVLRDLTASASGSACMVDQNCFEIRYSYRDGYLTEVAYPGGQVARYSYDDLGRLILADDPRMPVAPRMAYTYSEDSSALAAAYILHPDEEAPNEDSFLWRGLQVEQRSDRLTATVSDEYGRTEIYAYQLESGRLDEAGGSYTLSAKTGSLADAGGFDAVPVSYEWEDGLLRGLPLRALPGTTARGRNSVEFDYAPDGWISGLRGGYPGYRSTLISDTSLPQEISFADGTSLRFGDYSPEGLFGQFTDRQGSTYVFERDEQGHPTRITRTNDGVYWELDYRPGDLGYVQNLRQFSGLEEDAGYQISYAYDSFGRLVEITDAVLGTYRLSYEALTEDGDGGFVSRVRIMAPAGAETVLSYDGRGRLIESLLLVPDQDAARQRTTYFYDPADLLGRLSSMTHWLDDENGLTTTYTYSPEAEIVLGGDPVRINGERITITDAYGRSSYRVMDALGRIRLSSDDGQMVRRYDYDVSRPENPQPSPGVNVNGLTIIQSDFFGDALIARTRYVFDFGWQLTAVEQERGRDLTQQSPVATTAWRVLTATVNTIDSTIRRLQSPDLGLSDVIWENSYEAGRANAVEVSYVRDTVADNTLEPNLSADFDFLGRPLSVTQTVNGARETRALVYCPQPQGAMRVLVAAPGQTITCESTDFDRALFYDAHDRLVRVEEAGGTLTYTYSDDAENGGTILQIASRSEGADSNWTLHYDATGALVNWDNGHGAARRYTYDALNRLVAIDSDEPEHERRFTYNAASLLIEEIDGLGRGTRQVYDAAGHLILRQDVLTSNATTYIYDNDGRLSSIISPLGAVTTLEYSDLVDPRRVTAILTPLGRTEYIWDDARNQVSVSDPLGSVSTYSFDAFGRLWQTEYPGSLSESYAWDEAGTLGRWQSAGELTRAFELQIIDAGRELNLRAEGLNNWAWMLGLNGRGQLIGLEHPGGQQLSFSYDLVGRLTGVDTGIDENAWHLSYDLAEPLLSLSDGFGNQTDYRYDSLYRRVSEQSGGALRDAEYASSAGISSVRMTGIDGVQVITEIAGDQRSPQRTIIRQPGERVTYTYNAEGLLEEIAHARCLDGAVSDLLELPLSRFDLDTPPVCADVESSSIWFGSTRIRYNALGEPIRIVDAEQGVESFSYDSAGRLVAYQNRDGQTTTYTYDSTGRLNRISSPGGVDLLMSYALDRVAGLCQSASERNLDYAACVQQGGLLESYTYDEAGRLVSRSYRSLDSDIRLDYAYAASAAGGLSEFAGTDLRYTADGLALLEAVSGSRLSFAGLDRIASIAGANPFDFTYDSAGRLSELRSDTVSLMYAYEPDAFSLSSDGAELRFVRAANGLLTAVETAGEAVLAIEHGSQEDSGITGYTLLWGDDALSDFRANRRGDAVTVEYIPLGEILTMDTTYSPEGAVQRLVFTSFDPVYFGEALADDDLPGIVIVLGTDRNDNPLTMRVTNLAGDRVLYQSTFVYDDTGQLLRELRQYADGTQVRIDERYEGPRGQLSSRTISVVAAGVMQQSSLPGGGLLALVGLFILLRGRQLRRLLMALVLMLPLLLVQVSNLSVAQDGSSQTFRFSYDPRGNLSAVRAGETLCVSYGYDDANRLISVQTRGESVRYAYDLFGRLTSADDARFMYSGNDPSPVLVDADGTHLIARSAEGITLLETGSGTASAFVQRGRQVLGQRPYGAGGMDPVTLALYDPFGRPLAFAPPARDPEDPCALWMQMPESDARFRIGYNGMLWDTQTGLMFDSGRAYAPELARYLQRDSMGPDALGRIYAFAGERAVPPVPHTESDMALSLLMHTSLNPAAGLDALSVLSRSMPEPLATVQEPFVAQTLAIRTDFETQLAELTNLPSWLANQYNLPGAQYETDSGILNFLMPAAPGHGGWGSPKAAVLDPLDFAAPPLFPARLPTMADTLTSLAAKPDRFAEPLRMWLPQAWIGLHWNAADLWYRPEPVFTIEQEPAAVLARLPQSLNTEQLEATLTLREEIADLPSRQPQHWLQSLLDQALPVDPQLEALPEPLWGLWYGDDLTGLRDTLRLPLRPPEVLTYPVGPEAR